MVLSRLKGCPLSIVVLRWRAQDGTVYRPLIKLLRALKMENPSLQFGPATSQQSAAKEESGSSSQCLKEGRQVDLKKHTGVETFCHMTLTHISLTGLFTLCSFWGKLTLEW